MLDCEIAICNASFDDAGSYVNHLSKFHHVREFRCIICNELFNTTCVYKRHLIREYSKCDANNVSYISK